MSKLRSRLMKGKKLGKLSLNVQVTERDKKLLAVLIVVLIIALSYFLLYLPMSLEIETLKTNKIAMDEKVAAAKSDLENEQNIIKAFETELVKGKEASGAFFPQVYPYKDRYILLLEEVLEGSGVVINSINFSNPAVGGVTIPANTGFLLPGYPLLDQANKINIMYPDMEKNEDNPKKPQETTTAQDKNALPPDAVLKLPVMINFQGSYAQYRSVISSFEELNRTIALEGVNIKEGEAGGIDAILTVSFYAVEKIDNGEDLFNSWSVEGNYGKADPFN